MKKSKILIGIMTICIPLLVSGCTKTYNISSTHKINQPDQSGQTTNMPNEEQSSTDDLKMEPQLSNVPNENQPEVITDPFSSMPSKSEDNSVQPSGSNNKERFEIAKSDKISGWHELKAEVYLNKLTISSEGISYSRLPDYKMTTFLLDFPKNWEFNDYSVFNNEQNNKVAELIPAVKADISIDDLFQNYQPSVIVGETLLSKELFTVNGYQGLRIISQNQIPSWYPHIYYLSNGSNIFGMMFYSHELNDSDQQLFEKVISTFRFEQKETASS